MKTIQIVIDEATLKDADRAAQRARINRSDFVRRAIRRYVREMRIRELERRHQKAYEDHPVADGELDVWDRVLAWPEE